MMIEQAHIEPGQTILEIGAGTGYNAAILAELMGENGTVVTLDIDEDICDSARQNLGRAGYSRVNVVCADGAFGHGLLAPYDRILIMASVYCISPDSEFGHFSLFLASADSRAITLSRNEGSDHPRIYADPKPKACVHRYISTAGRIESAIYGRWAAMIRLQRCAVS